MEFGQPSAGGWFKPADHNGHLILVTKVHEIDPNHFDDMKKANVDKATFDFVDLDDVGTVLERRALNSHPGIVNKIASLLDNTTPVLGRIGQVPTNKGNPAWVLAPYDEDSDDAARATTWWEQNMAQNAVTQPASKPSAVAPSGPSAAAQPATPAKAPTASINTAELDPDQLAKLRAMGIVA